MDSIVGSKISGEWELMQPDQRLCGWGLGDIMHLNNGMQKTARRHNIACALNYWHCTVVVVVADNLLSIQLPFHYTEAEEWQAKMTWNTSHMNNEGGCTVDKRGKGESTFKQQTRLYHQAPTARKNHTHSCNHEYSASPLNKQLVLWFTVYIFEVTWALPTWHSPHKISLT